MAWRKKKASAKPKSVGFVQTLTKHVLPVQNTLGYEPFMLQGWVAYSADGIRKSVSVLRDTGAAQSLMLDGTLPLSQETYTGADVILRGIGAGCVKVPLHNIYLQTDIVMGNVCVGICPELPVEGMDIILGNNLAGGTVFPPPIVVNHPITDEKNNLSSQFPAVLSSCVVTRAQARKFEDVVNISDYFLQSTGMSGKLYVEPASSTCDIAPLKIGRSQLAAAQKADPSLETCFAAVTDKTKVPSENVTYFVDDGVLMRQWKKVVVPMGYRSQILNLAHDHVLSGHLGVRKTYDRVLRYFFWPGLKFDVVAHCRSCHVCQLAGKQNQSIPLAPLHPIPVIGEPFEGIIIDCVGPLPKSKSGYQYIL